MKDLLYYNPNVATHQQNFHLPGVEQFSKFFQIFNPTVVFLDRTNTIQIPFRVKSLFPMPEMRPMTKTFEEICNERAIELLTRADQLQVPLNVFYSGGIDSTLVLVSLLKNATPAQKANLVVLLSEESIMENPNFYRDHIYGKLRVDSSAVFPYLIGSNQMLIGGEYNDQLFGSNMVGRLVEQFGPESMHQKYDRSIFLKLFNHSLHDEQATNAYLDHFERLKAAAPIPIVTNFDYLWWINFAVKWQSVFMRMLSYATAHGVSQIDTEYPGTKYDHFYGTEDFQLWSMNNMDKKIKDQWKTYKWVCKDIIYEYTKDAEYRDNKIKRGSLHSILLQQDTYNFIDDSLKFWYELDLEEYYVAENDFIR